MLLKSSLPRRVRAFYRQTLMVLLINIPTLSFGLAIGWVSLASGESVVTHTPETSLAGDNDAEVVAAAAVTFFSSLVGVPLSALAIAAGRKPALIATSATFVVCWSLKLCGGGWWVVAARACAGLAGAGAWTLAPLLAREMCSEGVRGAAVSVLVLANNLGILLMLLAADFQLPHRTLLWSCLLLSLIHCVVFLFMPESPQYLAAHGNIEKARDSLAWLRGVDRDEPTLSEELAEFPTKEQHVPPLKLIKDMLSDVGRRRAFTVCCIAVVGQEACGVMSLMQFAERVFVVARDHDVSEVTSASRPARHAVWLGAAQLLASAIALYLVEKVGRKPLIVWCGVCVGSALLLGAAALLWRASPLYCAAALAAAVFADAAGLAPAPYAMLADMFHYQYRGCAVALVSALAWLGNAVEVVMFPLLASHAGLAATLIVSAVLTLLLSIYTQWRVPETRGRRPIDIYAELLGQSEPCVNVNTSDFSTNM